MQTIAVLMTCHNRMSATLECLTNLISNQLPEGFTLSVYLTDDGSTDGTGAAVRKKFPEVCVLEGNGELFWNRGMHKAWEAASKEYFDYYLWLNDDTNLYEDALSVMFSAAFAQPDSVICGATVSPDASKNVTYGGYRSDNSLIAPDGTLQSCNWFNGNCVLVPRTVFDVVGNLDFTFRHAVGDFDFGIRCGIAGTRMFVAAEVIGTCAQHDVDPRWRRSDVPVVERLKSLYSPLGCNPVAFFKYDRRKSGISMAIIHFFSIHLRAVFPALWK